MHKITQRYEDDVWLTKVYDKLYQSTNDVPLLRVLKRLKQDTEKQISSDRPLQQYVDSEIIHDSPPPLLSHDDDTIAPYDHPSTGEDDDNPNPPYDHLSTGEDDDNPSHSSNGIPNSTPAITVTSMQKPAQKEQIVFLS